tara:strand:- start:137 stop:544 length:408 start_codon:yes stop_codon:yes gene_type:complete
MSTKRNKLKIANITPKDFSPPPFRYFNHIRIPAIRDAEMKHFKNFIESMGGSSKGFVKGNKKSDLKIANLSDGKADSSIMNYVTEKGFFLDGQGNSYMQTGGSFYDAGEYNPDIHGLPVPLVKKNKKKRSQLQIA